MSLLGKEWYGEYIAHKDGFKEGVEEGFKVGYETAKKELEERETGKWINDPYPIIWRCSCCDWYTDFPYDGKPYNYCPKCGARMEVDNDEICDNDCESCGLDLVTCPKN